MCRMFLGAPKLGCIQIQHIGGTWNINEVIVDKTTYEGNDCFAMVHAQNESNVARKAFSIDIAKVCKKYEDVKTIGLSKYYNYSSPVPTHTVEERNFKRKTRYASNEIKAVI